MAGTTVMGRLCVAPVSDEARHNDLQPFKGRGKTRPPHDANYRFVVAVDGKKTSLTQEPAKFEGLDPGEKHSVQIWDGRKKVQSFAFEFTPKGGREFCLYYNVWDKMWMLAPRVGFGQCQCRF